jgi:phosphate uptake regulator
MNRKLIKQGKGGLTVYLPKGWIERKHLKPGDEVRIDDTDAGLLIGSAVKKKQELVFDIGNIEPKKLRVILTHMYRVGYDKIFLKNVSPTAQAEIKSIVAERLLGFEVTSKTKSSCTIENISEPTEEKYEVLLRRCFLMVKEMQQIIKEDANKSNFSRLKEAEELMKGQDRFVYFCRRVLFKERYVKSPMIQWELLTFIMHFQHTYYYLYTYASKNHAKPNKDVKDLLKNLEDYFNLFYEAYFKRDIDKVYRMNTLSNRYQFGQCLTSLEKSKSRNTVLISYIRELFRLMQVGTSPILSTILEERYQGSS